MQNLPGPTDAHQETLSDSIDCFHDLSKWGGEPIMVVFFIALEQPLPIPEDQEFLEIDTRYPVEWVAWNGGYNFVGMRFHRPTERIQYAAGKDRIALDVAREAIGSTVPKSELWKLDDIVYPWVEVRATVVEAATTLQPTADGDPTYAVSDAFDYCLKALRRLMRTYFRMAEDVRFRPISRQTCRPVVPWTTQTVEGEWGPLRIFHAHEGTNVLPFAPEELGPEGVAKLKVMVMRDYLGDPIAGYAEQSRIADRAYQVEGDYPAAVIHSYTACEVLLNTLLLMAVWEEGGTQDSTRPWFAGQMGFLARVKTHLCPRIGGDWGNQSPEKPIAQLERLSSARHSIAHGGWIPEEPAALEALAATKAIDDFAKARFAAKRRVYPRTALLLLGEPGLRRLGCWDRWMQRFVADHAAQEDPWLLSFGSWRDR